MPELPLFPLRTVLVPGEQLPLRVFEPRYVALLRDLLDHPERAPEFGVVAIRTGHEVGGSQALDLYGVGCVARLTQVESGGDGTFQVMTRGARRFRLDGFIEGARTPYLTAQITWMNEPLGDPHRVSWLLPRARAALSEYQAVLGVAPSPAPTGATELSYHITESMILEVSERHALLASLDTGARLGLAVRLLRREHALIGELRAIPNVLDIGGATSN